MSTNTNTLPTKQERAKARRMLAKAGYRSARPKGWAVAQAESIDSGDTFKIYNWPEGFSILNISASHDMKRTHDEETLWPIQNKKTYMDAIKELVKYIEEKNDKEIIGKIGHLLK